MADKIVLSGPILKYKSWLQWSSKQFVLTNETLSYSTTVSLPGSRKTLGWYHVHKIDVQSSSGYSYNILQNGKVVMYLMAASHQEKWQWMDAINNVKESIVHFGNLKKWTNLLKGWQQRYFILYNDRLCYYLSDTVSTRRGTIVITNRAVITSHSAAKHGFDIFGSSTTWFLKATSDTDKMRWMSVLGDVTNQAIVDLPPSNALSSLSGPSTAAPQGSTAWHSSAASQGSTAWLSSSQSSSAGADNSAARANTPSVADEDSDVETNYRKDLECNICLDLLREPTSLTCGHSYCRNCLAELWVSARTRFLCPSCRQPIVSVPSVNIAMQNLIQILYSDELRTEPIPAGNNREAFDTFCSTQNVGSVRHGNNSGTHTTNMEFEFLKRGIWLIFLISLCGKCITFLYSLHSSSTTNERFAIEPENTSDASSLFDIESRGTVIFLIVGLLECPRFLGLYIVLFWYSSVFFPAIDIVAKLSNQVAGVGLQLKVLLWGALVPTIWLVPVLYYHRQFSLAVVCLGISGVEMWGMALNFRQLLAMQHDRNTYIINTVKMSGALSLMRLLCARFLSFLPWAWLPDVLYNCIVLCLTAVFVTRNVLTIKGLIERTQAIRVNIPGVQISSVLINRINNNNNT